MGLLDVFNSDEGLLGLSLLSAAGPSAVPASLGQRMAGAAQSYRQQKSAEEERRMLQAYRQAQMQAMQESAEDRQVAREDRLLTRQRAEEQRRLLQGLFPAPVSGAQAVSMAGGPTNAAAELQGTVPKVDPSVFQRLVAGGVPVDTVKALAESQNWGKPKVARTVETTDAQGRPVTVQVDDYGARVGDGLPQWKAPVMVNLGDRISAVDPVSLTARGQFGVNMSPAERDNSARGWASNRIAEERLRMDKADVGPNGMKAPSGYAWTASGHLQPIAGGPADEGRKPMTDAQAKANLFGTRAAESSSVIDSLAKEGVTRPGNINSAASAVPFVGNQLSNLTNWTQSNDQQMVSQARRDFINAILRRESGAVISDTEFANAERQYFPQVGDSADTIALKRKNRETAVSGILSEVPEGKRSPIKPFSKIVTVEGGTSVAARLGEDGNYYVTRNGKRYRVEE